MASLCENVMSCTKQELRSNVTYGIDGTIIKGGPHRDHRQHVQNIPREMQIFRHASGQTDSQIKRETDRRADHNTSSTYRGEVNAKQELFLAIML